MPMKPILHRTVATTSPDDTLDALASREGLGAVLSQVVDGHECGSPMRVGSSPGVRGSIVQLVKRCWQWCGQFTSSNPTFMERDSHTGQTTTA